MIGLWLAGEPMPIEPGTPKDAEGAPSGTDAPMPMLPGTAMAGVEAEAPSTMLANPEPGDGSAAGVDLRSGSSGAPRDAGSSGMLECTADGADAMCRRGNIGTCGPPPSAARPAITRWGVVLDPLDGAPCSLPSEGSDGSRAPILGVATPGTPADFE